MASAITGKGVTTSSDATFETMANNIEAIPVGKCISLGNGTSFNVKTVCANNGIDYTKLTNSNFIVGASSCGQVTSPLGSTSGIRGARAYGFTVTKNYNASSGVLTVGGNAQTVAMINDSSEIKQSVTQTATCFAYLVYTG